MKKTGAFFSLVVLLTLLVLLGCQAKSGEANSKESVSVDICRCLTEPGNSAFMKENRAACRIAISEAVGVDDWEKTNFSKDPVASARFDALSKRCLDELDNKSAGPAKNNTSMESSLPVVKTRGGGGRSVDFRGFNADDESTFPAGDAGSYFINGCDGGSIAPQANGVSSVLPDWKDKSYAPANMLDRDPLSAWVEGKSDYGIGEWFEIYCNNLNTIYNGYQSSPENWLNNSRVKRFKVYIDGKPLCYLDLTDEMGEQNFELPFKSTWDKGHIFRFEIVSVYKGNKWSDVCISEIGVQGCCVLADEILNAEGSTGASIQVQGLDLRTKEIKEVPVLSSAERIHFTLWELAVGDKTIKVSPEHKFYFKGQGFIPILQLCDRLQALPENIPNHGVELLMFDGKQTYYQRLDRLTVHKGEFRTIAVRSLGVGDHFLINGFVQRAY